MSAKAERDGCPKCQSIKLLQSKPKHNTCILKQEEKRALMLYKCTSIIF